MAVSCEWSLPDTGVDLRSEVENKRR